MTKTINEWVNDLSLKPHPEGGYYKEVIRKTDKGSERPAYTSIYFLLATDNISHFHRIDADEVWYYHAGETLTVHMIHPDGKYETVDLGTDIASGEVLQTVVPAGTIFASSIKDEQGFAIVGCMCQPGFVFEHFEMFDQATLKEAYPQHAAIIEKYAVGSLN